MIGNVTTGLGNPDTVLLDNSGMVSDIERELFDEVSELYRPLQYGLDYRVIEGQVIFGIEPAYQYDDLLIISINRVKGLSYIQTGHAFGSYGSAIRSKYMFYKDYKRKSKFTRFIDKWHTKLYENSN